MTTWRPSFEERDCPCIEWRMLTLLLITRMIILKFGEQCKYWWVVMLSFRHMHNIGDHWYDCMFYTCAHSYKIQIIFVYWLACFNRLVFSSELSGYQAKFEKAMSWTKHTYVVSLTCINQAHCIINIWWFTHFKPYSWYVTVNMVKMCCNNSSTPDGIESDTNAFYHNQISKRKLQWNWKLNQFHS